MTAGPDDAAEVGAAAAPPPAFPLDSASGWFSSSSSDPSESSNAASISRADEEVLVRCGRGDEYEKDEVDALGGGYWLADDVDRAGDGGTFEYDIQDPKGGGWGGGDREDDEEVVGYVDGCIRVLCWLVDREELDEC